MSICKNRRTLKRRIRNIISLCILFTVLLLSGSIICVTAHMFKAQAVFLSDHFSYSISQTMNSAYFLKLLEINGLEEFNADSIKATEWLESLKSSEDVSHLAKDSLPKPDNVNRENRYTGKKPEERQAWGIQLPRTDNMLSTVIELKGKIIYSAGSSDISDIMQEHLEEPGNGFAKKLLSYYSDAESTYPLKDSKGNIIGKVTSQINSEFLFIIFMSLAGVVIIAAILSLLVANIINRLLTIPVTSPLSKLECKIRSLASEEFVTGVDKQIFLKKPLREIELLADSTNLIMHKMKEYNDRLEEQKLILEKQNVELEAQNEDLIESKKQIQETQSLLIQSENMASIGQLTAAITHEINTPLGAINSNVQICEMLISVLSKNEQIHANEELSYLMGQMNEANSISIMACQRVSEIIKSLKTFSRLDQAEFQEANINDGMKSVLVLTSNLWKRKITIHEDYDNQQTVKCFCGLLNQVFMNIVVNAIQAIRDKGDIYITTYSDENFVCVSIKDTGMGIREENLPKIFETGFSTKGAGIGMGLGLSICQNIIKKHNGEIVVNSELGKGTEFIIKIPLENTKT